MVSSGLSGGWRTIKMNELLFTVIIILSLYLVASIVLDIVEGGLFNDDDDGEE